MDEMMKLHQDNIRKIWHNEQWFFSVIDIVGVLTEQSEYHTARKYWNKLSERLKNEGSQVVTNCHRLKIVAKDGKMRETDVANIETILRLIQSIPSPKAEPLKLWLAKVGSERIAEIQDPAQGIDRVRSLWKKHGRSEQWIQQRMMGQETRNKLTDYWKEHEVNEGKEFAILTNIIHEEWADLSIKEHKALKDLDTTTNLRDHMNEAELILTALAELSTRQIAEYVQAVGLEENTIPAKKGGKIAKNARELLESQIGGTVISGKNDVSQDKQLKTE